MLPGKFIYRAAVSKAPFARRCSWKKMQEELPEKDEDQRKRVLASRKREKEIPEGRYLNLLELRTRDGKVLDDAVNSIMRGLQISDSLPVPDSQMMLSKKVDVNQDGEAHTITCVRECIRPEVELHLKLTLDQSVCKGKALQSDSLLQTVDSFADDYYKTYVEKFRKPVNSAYEEYQYCLIFRRWGRVLLKNPGVSLLGCRRSIATGFQSAGSVLPKASS